MDIEKEIRMTEKSYSPFCDGAEMEELYKAVIKRWKINTNAFDASLFYTLGYAHGKRAERARRKGRCEA
ncbi:MAG: hypothetical protein ACOX8E_07390 [Ruminococcus sp.]|jgi:hypothetical protein